MSLYHVFLKTPGFVKVLAIIAAVLTLRLLILGAFPLIDPSEGRYAEISREMAETGNWIMPQFEAGEPFWGKPPLFFWSAAAAIKLFGATAFATRLPSFIFSLLSLSLVFLLARQYRGPDAAWTSVLILSTSLLFYVLSGITLIDTALAFTTTAALASAYIRQRLKISWHKLIFTILFVISLSGALLSKGFLALLIIVPPVLILNLYHGPLLYKMKQLAKLALCIIIALLLTVPWYMLAENQTPGFLQYYIFGEHLRRFIEPHWQSLYGRAHVEPLGTIWIYFSIGFMPWILFLPLYFPKLREMKNVLKNSDTLFFLSWALTTPVIFSFTKGIMIPYALPAMPALAILLGSQFARKSTTLQINRPRILAIACFVPIAFAFVTFVVMPFVGIYRSQALIQTAMSFLDQNQDADLVYFTKMPYSADFYAKGNSTYEPDANRSNILRYLNDSRQTYIVIPRERRKVINPFVKKHLLEIVLQTPRQLLLREYDNADLPRSALRATLPSTYRIVMFLNHLHRTWHNEHSSKVKFNC